MSNDDLPLLPPMTVIRGYNDGFATAVVTEPNGAKRDWVLGRDVVEAARVAMPPAAAVKCHRGQPEPRAHKPARVPFWQQLRSCKR